MESASKADVIETPTGVSEATKLLINNSLVLISTSLSRQMRKCEFSPATSMQDQVLIPTANQPLFIEVKTSDKHGIAKLIACYYENNSGDKTAHKTTAAT